MVMEYPNEQYEPPPPVIQSASDSHVMVSEELDHEPHKDDGKKKKGMSIGHALTATRTRSVGIGQQYGGASLVIEIVGYVIFLIAVIIASVTTQSREQFYYNKFLRNTFQDGRTDVGMDFTGIQQYDDVFKYLDQVFLPALFFDPVDGIPQTPFQTALPGNQLLTKPEIRMVMVTNTSCEVPHPFNREVKECFGNYEKKNEYTEPLVLGDETNNITLKWASETKLQNREYSGKISTYSGGGYILDLENKDLSSIQTMFDYMQSNRMLDRGSRALLITFTLCETNANLYSVVRAVFELPEAGGVIPRLRIYGLDLTRYSNNGGTVIAVCEGIIMGMICYFLFGEAVELLKNRMSYFCWWNAMELTVVASGIATIVLGMIRNSTVNEQINQLYQSNLTNANIDEIVFAQNRFQEAFAIFMFFSCIKLFKFLSMHSLMSQLTQTLMRSAIDIACFFIVFLVFFLAYAVFGYVTFGTQVEDYSQFMSACIALLRTVLGDFDFKQLQLANSVFGPLFFVTYIVLVYFVLMNMFLAIISDSYMDVKEELLASGARPSIKDIMNETMNRMFHTKRDSDEENLDPSNYEEYAKELRKLGYKEDEILIKHSKYTLGLDDPKSMAMQGDEEAGVVGVSTSDNAIVQKQLMETEHCHRRVDILEESICEALLILNDVIKKEETSKRIEHLTAECKEREELSGVRSRFVNNTKAVEPIDVEPIKSQIEKKDD